MIKRRKCEVRVLYLPILIFNYKEHRFYPACKNPENIVPMRPSEKSNRGHASDDQIIQEKLT